MVVGVRAVKAAGSGEVARSRQAVSEAVAAAERAVLMEVTTAVMSADAQVAATMEEAEAAQAVVWQAERDGKEEEPTDAEAGLAEGAELTARRKYSTAGKPGFQLPAAHTVLRCCPGKGSCAPSRPDRARPGSLS
jgi:hypothetical protein